MIAASAKTGARAQSKIQEAFNLSFTSIKNPFLTKPRSLPYFDPLLVEEYDQEIYEHWRMLFLQHIQVQLARHRLVSLISERFL